MGNKYHYGIYGLAFAALVLLISSPVAAAPTLDSVNLNTLSTEPSLEFINLIPGKGSAVLTNMFAFGATSSLAGDSESGLAEASEWLVLYGNQADFGDYLNRIPMEIPDGLLLIVSYDKSDGFADAANAKTYIEGLYGISLLHVDDEVGTGHSKYVFWAEPSDTLRADVAADVAGVSSSGFSASMSASLVTGSPVSWAGYGVRHLDSARISVHGMGFVDPHGITTSGSVNTLSTMNVLGSTVSSLSPTSFGLSRIEFKFPYPVSPSSISPVTTNPLPHVTGQMVWDVRHPGYTSSSASGNYEVTFEVGLDPAFPLVTNELSINKTKLDVDGNLEVVFDLENVGLEAATDVTLNFPLGPDFGQLLNQDINIYRVKSQYQIDETFESSYTVSLSVAGVDQFNYEAFVLTGWYNETIGEAPAIWTGLGGTSQNLYSETYLGNAISLDISSTNGMPTPLDTLITTQLIPALAGVTPSLTAASELINIVKTNLKPMLKDTFNSSFTQLYEAVDSFNFAVGDFQLVQEEVLVGPSATETQWFLRKVIASLAPGATETVSFSLNDIPVKSDKLAFMQFLPSETSEGYPKAQLISQESNYEEVIQYIFQTVGFDGRPISFPLPDELVYHFEAFEQGSIGSIGAPFTWKNGKGFPFFGLSNGLNLQIADDEAMIKASVNLDKTVYHPGDTVTMTVNVENIGDIAAENIEVHLLHTSLGKDWYLWNRLESIATETVGTLAAGASTEFTVTAEVNSYLGYAPVFAIVEFDSDVSPASSVAIVPDFLDLYPGDTVSFEAAGTTHHYVSSTLSGALVLPLTNVQEPSIPEPQLAVETSSDGDTVTYRIENVGGASTVLSFVQNYDNEILTVTNNDVVVTGATSRVSVVDAAGLVLVDEVTLAPGDFVEIKVTYANPSGEAVALPPAIIEFTTEGESSLGTVIEMGDGIVAPSMNSLSLFAGAAAQQQSQQSATEDSSSAAFSASSSVGASVAVGGDTSSTKTVKGDSGFIGMSAPETLGLMLSTVTILTILRRRKQ
ncbi:MAG: hypothetical protein GPJ54_00310 [Candidatus Heimdallarchaeota archaeon]|nr:hypothetical protein [Candidatus Heimdallarchaeota archaeon]